MAEETQQQPKTSSASDYESDLSTMFILDLLRQKREKLMRLKKDELINEMAMKQKAKMAEAQSHGGYFVCDGTRFRGVQQIIDGAKEPGAKGGYRKKQQ